MTKIAASTSVVQPVGIRSQPTRDADGGHGSRRVVSLINSILRRSLLVGTLP
jgi:hypothetical protein